MNRLQIANGTTSLSEGAVVILNKFPETKWILNFGWYKLNDDEQLNGWYFSSIPAGTVISATSNDLSNVVVVDPGPLGHSECCCSKCEPEVPTITPPVTEYLSGVQYFKGQIVYLELGKLYQVTEDFRSSFDSEDPADNFKKDVDSGKLLYINKLLLSLGLKEYINDEEYNDGLGVDPDAVVLTSTTVGGIKLNHNISSDELKDVILSPVIAECEALSIDDEPSKRFLQVTYYYNGKEYTARGELAVVVDTPIYLIKNKDPHSADSLPYLLGTDSSLYDRDSLLVGYFINTSGEFVNCQNIRQIVNICKDISKMKSDIGDLSDDYKLAQRLANEVSCSGPIRFEVRPNQVILNVQCDEDSILNDNGVLKINPDILNNLENRIDKKIEGVVQSVLGGAS